MAMYSHMSPSQLAARCQITLDDRLRSNWAGTSGHQLVGREYEYCTDTAMGGLWRWHPGSPGTYWFMASGWQERNETLFRLAGEVTRKLGVRQP